MKLQVHVVEARGLAARDENGLSDPFVRLQLGSTKAKSATVYKTLNPTWNEEYIFNVEGSDGELLVVVWDEDRFSRDFLGQVKIPISDILTAEKQTITRKWYTLQRSEKSKFPVTGKCQKVTSEHNKTTLLRLLKISCASGTLKFAS